MLQWWGLMISGFPVISWLVRYIYLHEPLYCGHLWDQVKVLYREGVLISGVDLYRNLVSLLNFRVSFKRGSIVIPFVGAQTIL